MTREEKIQLAIEKGFTYDALTGKVYGIRGKEVINRHNMGYITMSMQVDKKKYFILCHHFAWYMFHKEVVEELDHINGIRYDNRIINLRSVTRQQNRFNNHVSKGYSWDKRRKKFQSKIKLNKKTIHLGMFDKEEDARRAYLDAKQIYHKIN